MSNEISYLKNVQLQSLSDEDRDKIYSLCKIIFEAYKKIADEIISAFKQIVEFIKNRKEFEEAISNYKKYIKHEKRVRNRNKLYAKRKSKYGKD